MPEESPITARNAPDRRRYELVDAGAVVAQCDYLPFGTAAGPQRILHHTTVDESYGGQGLGGRLARFAVEGTIDAGLQIVPVCPFIKAWLGRHPEYDAHVAPVRPEHLAAVPPGSGRPD